MEKTFHTVKSPLFSFIILFTFTIVLHVTPSHAQSTQKDNSVIIDNGDLLYVIIPREVTSEFSPTERNFFKEKVEVDRHGFIFLPSQGNIKISGYTTDQISEILTNNLPKYLSKSDKATVNLIEKRHYIQILGHVMTPGWYNIAESANIQAILSQAGGALEGADLSKVTISRKGKTKSKKIQANIQQYLLKGDTRTLPPLHENDTVFVPLNETTSTQPASNATAIRIFGAVNSPGIYPAPKEMNFLDLLITAQGEAADADLTNIKIMRGDGAREVFNMQALLNSETTGKATSFPVIHGGDIVHISRREQASIPVNTLPQTITITGPGSNGRGQQSMQSFTAQMTPIQAIAQSGGLSDFADTNDIIIIRRVDGKQENFPYNHDKALKGETPDVNFLLEAGDLIYIP